MNMDFKRKLPIPKDIKEMFPISEEYQAKRDACDKEIKAILDGSDDRLLMVIGPCSADNEEAVLDYLLRLRKVQDKVKTAIENMTGLMVLEVNIKIAGVNMPAEA